MLLCPTLWDPMGCSMPGFPVFHHLPEFAQTHVWWISNAVQPSYPLLSPSLIFPNIRDFPVTRLFTSGGQSIGASASVLAKHIQNWFPLGLTSLIPLLSKGLSRFFSSTGVRRHQAQENKVCHCVPNYLPCSDGTGCHNLAFGMLSFKPAFSLASFGVKYGIYSWGMIFFLCSLSGLMLHVCVYTWFTYVFNISCVKILRYKTNRYK